MGEGTGESDFREVRAETGAPGEGMEPNSHGGTKEGGARSSSPAAEGILQRVEAEVEAGRLWRAREILQGAVREFATDPVILERYGRLLDRLGDRVEAGKYLFLSGARGAEVDPAIEVFLRRHGRGHLNHLLRQFPAVVRKTGIDSFPSVVREDLVRLGLPAKRVSRGSLQPLRVEMGLWDQIKMVGCFVAAIVLGVAMVLGLVTMGGWVIDVMTSA